MKEVYYFQHDYNPTSDPKIVCLLGEYGGLGYGVYWRIVEMLHQENEHKLPLKQYIYVAIAKQMLTDAKQIEAIIKNCVEVFELLQCDDSFFWSNRVLRNIDKREEISKIRSEAGKKGAKVKYDVAIAKQMLTDAKQNLAKESKVKESKVNNIIDIELATLLRDKIKENLPTFKEPNIDSWAKEIEKMRRIDKRTEEQIRYLIEWCQQDSFWQGNILSTKKLREKFDTLVAQIKRAKTNSKGITII